MSNSSLTNISLLVPRSISIYHVLNYYQMFLTAVVSIILYSLIFLRLRGNLNGSGWDLKFRRVTEPWAPSDFDYSQMSAVGKQMLW